MNRPSWGEVALEMAKAVAKKGTCCKRQVGAVVLDGKNYIVSTGYNGPPSGQPHCIDEPCKALTMAAPVSHLACRAVHAEANALLQAGRRAQGGTIAITTSPCLQCAQLIVNAGIRQVFVGELNRLFNSEENVSITPSQLLDRSGISVILKEM